MKIPDRNTCTSAKPKWGCNNELFEHLNTHAALVLYISFHCEIALHSVGYQRAHDQLWHCTQLTNSAVCIRRWSTAVKLEFLIKLKCCTSVGCQFLLATGLGSGK